MSSKVVKLEGNRKKMSRGVLEGRRKNAMLGSGRKRENAKSACNREHRNDVICKIAADNR